MVDLAADARRTNPSMSGSPDYHQDDDDADAGVYEDDDKGDGEGDDEDEDDGDGDLADSEVWLQGFSEAGRGSLVGAHLTEQRVHCFPADI